jgi:hypothetical protein
MAILDDLIVVQIRVLDLIESTFEGPVKDLFKPASNPANAPLDRTARRIARTSRRALTQTRN